MKKVMIICALMISAVTFTKAQGGGQAAMAPEDRAKAAFESPRIATLALTADQKTKATPILVGYYKAQTEAMTKIRDSGADFRTAMTDPKYVAIGTDAEKAILAAVSLTDDQKKAYDALLAAAKERQPTASTVIVSAGGFGGRQGGGGGQGGGGAAGGAARPAGQ